MAIDKDFLLVLTSSEIGSGMADLGERLTGLLLTVFSGSEDLPAKMIFLNSAIFLTTEGSPVADQLKSLEERGVEIISCITCLNYYQRMERIVVGKSGDMKETVKALTKFKKVITF